MIKYIRKILLQFLPNQHRYLRYLFLEDFRSYAQQLALDGAKKDIADLRILIHSIEKSFVIQRSRDDFGKEKIIRMIKLLSIYEAQLDEWTRQYVIDIITAYYHHRVEYNLDVSFIPERFHFNYILPPLLLYTKPGKTDFINFEAFAKSRHSVRIFKNAPLDIETLEKAVLIAQTAPSACNRQSTRVHAVYSPSMIKDIMEFHKGTSCFTPPGAILVLTGDLSYYISEYERHTVFIDGGLFMMNLLYALHYVGLATIPVIWGSIPENDSWLRKLCSIPEQEFILGLIFVGYFPDKEIPVALSRRRPLNQILFHH